MTEAWQIKDGPAEVDPIPRDADERHWLWTVQRGAEKRTIRVVMSGTLAGTDPTTLPSPIDQTVATLGRPEVLWAMERDRFPARVTDDHAAWKCDCLSLLIGRRDEAGVRESLLGGASESDNVVRIWRALIRQAKAEMHKGALVHDPASGAQRQLPAHRHTVGAHQLVEHGIKMLAAAGWNEYAFDDVTPVG
jgi:hypothetical protein